MRLLLVSFALFGIFILIFLLVPTVHGVAANKFESQFSGCEAVTLREEIGDQSLILSTRKDGHAAKIRTAQSASDWFASHATEIAELVSKSGDILVFVHGLNTDTRDATCAARLLWQEMDRAEETPGPGLIIFDWPSGFGAKFGKAQNMADDVAPYLTKLLDHLPPDRTFVAAHSLGVQVTLAAARHLSGDRYKALLLIQGAVPATSILTYSGWLKTYQAEDSLDPNAMSLCPFADIQEAYAGEGLYAPSVRRFARLVVTQAKRDRVLRKIFTTDEIVDPRNYGIPLALPDLRLGPRSQPALRPIGAIWPESFEHFHDSSIADRAFATSDDIGQWDRFDDPLDRMSRAARDPALTAPARALAPALCVKFDFALDHPNATLLSVRDHRDGWKPVIWHSPHFHDTMRQAMIDAVLAD